MVEVTFVDVPSRKSLFHSLDDPRPIRQLVERKGFASKFTTIGVINQINIQLRWQKVFDISLLDSGGITDLDDSSIVQPTTLPQPPNGLIVLC